ncbi:MAG: FadR/GntR family transcriptional regulator [Candidatus Latescibacterota bacterium]|jgi:GntR family transcriptional repressor for pyruvate dehydrogenase complex
MTLGTRGETPQGAEELQRVSRSSVSDAIVDQIIDLISRRVLQPGDRLPSERELCTRFGVGRTSVREALHSLSVMGILDGRVGSGTFVSDDSRYLEKTLEWGLLLDPKRVEDLVETRLMLESQTAYWAAQRATEENLGVMATTLQGMAAAVDEPDRFLEHDLQFHLEIARATQNSILSSLVGMTRRYLQEWIRESLKAPPMTAPLPADQTNPVVGRARLSLLQHEEILAALRGSDADAARHAMTAHILSSSEDLTARQNTDL